MAIRWAAEGSGRLNCAWVWFGKADRLGFGSRRENSGPCGRCRAVPARPRRFWGGRLRRRGELVGGCVVGIRGSGHGNSQSDFGD